MRSGQGVENLHRPAWLVSCHAFCLANQSLQAGEGIGGCCDRAGAASATLGTGAPPLATSQPMPVGGPTQPSAQHTVERRSGFWRASGATVTTVWYCCVACSHWRTEARLAAQASRLFSMPPRPEVLPRSRAGHYRRLADTAPPPLPLALPDSSLATSAGCSACHPDQRGFPRPGGPYRQRSGIAPPPTPTRGSPIACRPTPVAVERTQQCLMAVQPRQY